MLPDVVKHFDNHKFLIQCNERIGCTYYNTPLPIGKSIFDVVAGGVDKDSTVLPAGTLQTHVLINSTQALQLSVADSQG